MRERTRSESATSEQRGHGARRDAATRVDSPGHETPALFAGGVRVSPRGWPGESSWRDRVAAERNGRSR